MGLDPVIISYRSENEETSCFLNLDEVLKTNNYTKIKKIYENIFQSVVAYEPEQVYKLISVENKIYNNIVDLGKQKNLEFKQKNQGWKAVVLSLLTLGIRPLIFLYRKDELDDQMQAIEKIHLQFFLSLRQMQQRQLPKIIHPKQEALKKLENQKLENLDDELVRLNSIPRINASLTKVTPKLTLSRNHQIAYAHSLELREELKDTHYVINHGQNLELMLVNVVTQKLKQEFEIDRYESFEPLRHDAGLRHIIEDTHTVAWYNTQIKMGMHTDHTLRKELICGDCILESVEPWESALSFFSGKINVAKRMNPSLIHELLLTIIQDYIPNQKVTHALIEDLIKLMNRCPEGGNLYSICVPKEKFNESCYFSGPYGKPLENQEILKENIDKMQAGEYVGAVNPQIRILTHKIRPEEKFYVIMNSTFTSNQILEIEEAVSDCIQAALTGYRVRKEPPQLF